MVGDNIEELVYTCGNCGEEVVRGAFHYKCYSCGHYGSTADLPEPSKRVKKTDNSLESKSQ